MELDSDFVLLVSLESPPIVRMWIETNVQPEDNYNTHAVMLSFQPNHDQLKGNFFLNVKNFFA
jgi:hypothetical protein